MKGTWKDGKGEGLWEVYHDNGLLWYKGTYKDGIPVGLWEHYQYGSCGSITPKTDNGLIEHFSTKMVLLEV